MKKILSYAFAASVLMLASCSNESDPVINNGGESSGEAQYLAVNICTPSDATRADYEYGEDYENQANTATFLIFKADGTQVSCQKDVNLTPWSDQEDGENIARISSAVLVVNGEEFEEDKVPEGYKILAILNDPGLTNFANMTLDQVLAEADDYVTSYTSESQPNFIMTNSVYNGEDGKTVNATPVLAKNFAKSIEAAKGSPVEIFVERVAAKVTTTAMADEPIAQPITFADGTTQEVYMQLKGIEIANIAKKSYLVKDITNLSNPFTGWNNSDNHRSFWAVNPTGDNAPGYKNQSWTDISKDKLTKDANHFYVQENAEGQTSATAVLVTAQFTEDKVGNDAFQFVRIASQYYTKDDGEKQLIGMFINSCGFYYKDGDKYKTLDTGWFDWSEILEGSTAKSRGMDKSWELGLSVAKGVTIPTLYTYSNGTYTEYTLKEDETTNSVINEALTGEAYRAHFWNDGYAYFFVNIENAAKLEGIVRNHVYALDIKSISGFGVPVVNPSEEIIPDQPEGDKNWYMAAQVNILQWKIETQNVNFNNDPK